MEKSDAQFLVECLVTSPIQILQTQRARLVPSQKVAPKGYLAIECIGWLIIEKS